jgi:hypothetical protein
MTGNDMKSLREQRNAARSPRPSRVLTYATLAMAVVVIVVAVILVFSSRSTGASNTARSTLVPAATPTIDPRLILHPRALPLSAALANGIHLGGTLSPSIPGPNTITLRVTRANDTAARATSIELVITMPGMSMAPIHERLDPQKGAYTGVVRLPMFGVYTAHVRYMAADGPQAGTLNLTVPL